jgi:hypothetical protein
LYNRILRAGAVALERIQKGEWRYGS